MVPVVSFAANLVLEAFDAVPFIDVRLDSGQWDQHFSQSTRKPVELADHISEDDCAIAMHLPNITPLAVFYC